MISIVDADITNLQIKIKIVGTEEDIQDVEARIQEMLSISKRIKIPIKGKNIRKILGEKGNGLERLKKRYNLGKYRLIDNYVLKRKIYYDLLKLRKS